MVAMKSQLDPFFSLSVLGLIVPVIVTYALSRERWRKRTRGLPLPPGPKGIPYIGNVADLQKPEVWKAHRELCNTYGDVVYLTVLGQPIVVLGSPQAIFELLDKRSALTSDRIQSPMVPLIGQGGNFSLMPYGNWWRLHRRAFWQHFLPASIERHVSVQKKYAQVFMRKLLEDPTRLCEHIRYTFAATVVKIIYGVDVADTNDRYISLIEKVLSVVAAFTPGRYLVETFPILQYVPEWFPGAGFQKDFREWRTAAEEVTTSLYREATERGDEDAINSVVAELARQVDQEGEEAPSSDKFDLVRNVGFTAFEGGADTTFSTLQSFFLAMSLYPEVQRKAQAELDVVIGPDRLPGYSDRTALPYVNAVVKEALRWQPVLVFSLPHMTAEDMEYSGYFIPKGTLLMPNSWACLHDPEVYPEPERFIPDRFMRDGKLDTSVRDPTRFAFGYGRRICPGRHFADATLFTNIAMILHTFDITPPLDENGKPIVIEPRMTDTMMSFPLDCRCTITPRSTKAKELILADDP